MARWRRRMASTVLAATGVLTSYDGAPDVLRDMSLQPQTGEAIHAG